MVTIFIAEPASIWDGDFISADRLPAVYQDPEASDWSVSWGKRTIDIIVALVVLLITGFPMVVIGICIRLTSSGRAIFIQERVGARGRAFRMYKFRTMYSRSSEGVGLTRKGDGRIMPMGRFLRKLKLDELPQFYNVLRGDMSLVGPRPKLAQYTDMFNMPYRPGITGWATLHFSNEESMLQSFTDPAVMETYYQECIKPAKARLDFLYMRSAKLGTDLMILYLTAIACLGWRSDLQEWELARSIPPRGRASVASMERSA
ncbi:MAG: sugar transferase [Acidobacteria bacterium]|nr:sugar transferase [Acidobacteriota bacterium]